MNIFKLMQAMRPYIQRGDMTYDLAIKYLKERGVQFDGLVKKALDNMFKKIKARDPVFDKNVTQMPIDDAGIPFNPKTLKSTTEKRGVESLGKDATPFAKSIQEFFDAPKAKRGVENLFKETKRVNIPAEKLNHQMIADQAGIDIELIKGKDWVEILEVLKGLKKADGGRIGFKSGGWDPGAGRDDRGYQSKGGFDYESEAYGAPDTIASITRSGRDVGSPTPTPPPTRDDGGKLNISPVVTYGGPYNHIENIGLQGNLGKLVAAGVIDLEDAITTGNIDPTIAAGLNLGNFNLGAVKDPDKTGIFAQGNIGPVNVGGSYQDFGDYGIAKNIGASGMLGNLGMNVNYDFESNPNLGLSYNNPDAGWKGGVNYNFEGKPEGMLTFSKKFKKGGRVGYDVGGLTGQAKDIYDSWISAGHSEEDTLAYLTSRGLYGDQEAEGIQTIVNTAPAITQGGDDRSIRMPITKKSPVEPTLQGDYDIYGKKIDESGKTGILQTAKSKIWDPVATVAGAALDVPLGLLTSGARMIGDMLPYNDRAVMENQMLEQGFALDDIGRIAQGEGAYDTAANVMAGYNAALLDEESFDKRIAMARAKMSEKNKYARIAALEAAKKQWQDARDKADAKKKLAEQTTNIGGGWTQTDTGGGTVTFSGPGGQTHQGWSNTPAGIAAATASEGSMQDGGLATMFTRKR
jgi:hypothetical protein